MDELVRVLLLGSVAFAVAVAFAFAVAVAVTGIFHFFLTGRNSFFYVMLGRVAANMITLSKQCIAFNAPPTVLQ